MNVGVRLVAFGAGLVVTFLLAFALGRAVGPVDAETDPASTPRHGGHETSVP